MQEILDLSKKNKALVVILMSYMKLRIEEKIKIKMLMCGKF